jgi:hypothetical protein
LRNYFDVIAFSVNWILRARFLAMHLVWNLISDGEIETVLMSEIKHWAFSADITLRNVCFLFGCCFIELQKDRTAPLGTPNA